VRRIIGTLLVLYSVLLGFSVTLPLVASVAGPKVSAITVDDPAACHRAIGSAPLAGFPQRCEVTWTTGQGEANGTLYGKVVDDLAAGSNIPQSAVYQLGNFALTAPVGETELMMAFLAPLILLIGLRVLSRRRRRRGHGHGGDSDSDDDDSGDWGDSGDSGGGDGGGGGD
jgi:hypothetical protein